MLYNQLSVLDDDEEKSDLGKIENPQDLVQNPLNIEESNHDKLPTSIQNQNLALISRLPPHPRDGLYGILFFLHIGVILTLFSISSHQSKSSIHHSTILNTNEKGSWSSIFMIVTTLGSFLGATISFLIVQVESREILFTLGIVFSILFQVCFGNLLLFGHFPYTIFGFLLLISATVDFFQSSHAKHNLNFTCALIDLALEVCRKFGLSLTLTCIAIVIVQTCLLLWWGVVMIGLLSSPMSTCPSFPFLFVGMLLSLLWTSQIFHSFISFIIGGCVLWYFLHEPSQPLQAPTRVFLYLRCAFTTSFGSICKASLYCPISQTLLSLDAWTKHRSSRVGCVSEVLKPFASKLASPFLPLASCCSPLGVPLAAAFGRTLCSGSEEQARHHPATLLLSAEDSSAFSLSCSARSASLLLTVCVAVMVDRNEGRAWALLFLLLFLLVSCGVSLATHAYRAAVDALFVAFSLAPDRFQAENQIVFLRFLRNSETALR